MDWFLYDRNLRHERVKAFLLLPLQLYQSNEESVPSSCSMGKCRRFLHKPTKDLMRSSGAVFQNNPEEYIYSDSSYYIDMQKCMSLLKWYRQKGGISCEIDAYGDFLQALGPEASSEYCRNIKNVTIALPDLIKTREEIFEVLKDTPLNVLMLNKSRFYHIGTTQEYIEHFCNDIKFRYLCCFWLFGDAHSELSQILKVKLFAKIVNGFQLFFAKSSISDVSLGYEYASDLFLLIYWDVLLKFQ